VRRDGTRRLDARGTIIGLGGVVPFEEETVALERGDRLYLYSDGIVERAADGGEAFGEARLGDALLDAARLGLEESCAAAMNSLEDFAEGAEADDDITLVAAEFRSR
jgi:sigma-B regulation protein RsbU (phosphoserine phosphatase)